MFDQLVDQVVFFFDWHELESRCPIHSDNDRLLMAEGRVTAQVGFGFSQRYYLNGVTDTPSTLLP